MPGIVALVAAISADVQARLVTAGYPPLTDGAILLGRVHVLEQSAPPRIVFVPAGSAFGPRDTFNRSTRAGAPSAEMVRQTAQRAIHNDEINFEVHVWGASTPPDPANNFDAAQTLYQAVIQSVRAICTGNYKLSPGGEWESQKTGKAQLATLGEEFVFGLSIGTPILDQLLQTTRVSSVEATVEFLGGSTDSVDIVIT